mmetsp:Transcript_77964/g.252099  ORF Transcript_77964/g.252099 Transcript_77964/m.252099 type:complete len:263 (+) Transcript_77964:551-1339(+)
MSNLYTVVRGNQEWLHSERPRTLKPCNGLANSKVSDIFRSTLQDATGATSTSAQNRCCGKNGTTACGVCSEVPEARASGMSKSDFRQLTHIHGFRTATEIHHPETLAPQALRQHDKNKSRAASLVRKAWTARQLDGLHNQKQNIDGKVKRINNSCISLITSNATRLALPGWTACPSQVQRTMCNKVLDRLRQQQITCPRKMLGSLCAGARYLYHCSKVLHVITRAVLPRRTACPSQVQRSACNNPLNVWRPLPNIPITAGIR